MHMQTVESPAGLIALVQSQEPLFQSGSDGLQTLMDVRTETGADRMVFRQGDIAAEFFDLSTRIAGEVLQKFINYYGKLAIVGDFSIYASKSLHDFIYECNNGNDIFFCATEEEAIQRLSKAL